MRNQHAGNGAERARDAQATETWRLRRETRNGREWLCVEVTAEDGARGEAWAPDTGALLETLAALVRDPHAFDEANTSAPHDADGAPCGRDERLARGMAASARLEAACRRHDVPLHVWLGGAVRQEIRVSAPVIFRASTPAARDAEAARERTRLQDAAESAGLTSFTIHDAATDVAAIAQAVAAVRDAVGPGAALTVRLAGQLDTADARALLARIRECDVICVADPCATVAQSVDASRDALPALGLSAARYTRASLLPCLAATPPAVLIIDPLLEGGPRAVRRLASIARVLQIDVSLTADLGDPWLVALCASLAAVVPASHQPIELPAGWTAASLRTLGVRAGALRPPAAPPALPELAPRAGAPSPAVAADATHADAAHPSSLRT